MKRLCRTCVWLVLATAITDAAVAQGRPGAPVMPGFSQGQNSNQPVQIEAATLVVREKSKMATFSGDVQVVQGDTTMRCQTLVVFYETDKGAGKPATAVKPTPGMPEGAQSIRRIEARGNVTVVTKDQNAQGDLGIFDMKTNTITLSGNVVVSQGQNVMRGERVVVDMTTGVSRVESGGKIGQNRVRALIQPGKGETPAGPPKILPVGPSKVN